MNFKGKKHSNPRNGLTNIQEDTEEQYASPDFTIHNQSQNSHQAHLPSGNLTPTNEIDLQQQMQIMQSKQLTYQLQLQQEAKVTLPLSYSQSQQNQNKQRSNYVEGSTPGEKVKMQRAAGGFEMRSNNYSASTQAYNQASESRQFELTPQSRKAKADLQNQFNSNSITPKMGRSPSQDGRSSLIPNQFENKQYEDKTPGQQLLYSSGKQVQRKYEFSQEAQPEKHMKVIEKVNHLVLKGDIDEEYKQSLLENKQVQRNDKQQSTKKQYNKRVKRADQEMETKSRQVKELINAESSSQNKIKKISDKSAKKKTSRLEVVVDTGNTIQSQEYLTSEIEAWKYTSNTYTKDARAHQDPHSSFEDSDVADEFEYMFDPEYQKNRMRLMSPQATRKAKEKLQGKGTFQQRKSSANNAEGSLYPLTSVKRGQQRGNLDSDRYFQPNQVSPLKSSMMDFLRGLEEFEQYQLIKRTCRDTTKNVDQTNLREIQNFRQRKNNFVNRMQVDVSLRDNRDKQFQELKHVVAMKQNYDHYSIASQSISPERRDRSCIHNQTKGDISAISPQRNRSLRGKSPGYANSDKDLGTNQLNNTNFTVSNQHDLNHLSPLFTSPTRSLQNIQSMLMSPSSQRKKLKKNECEQIFERLMTKEAGRQQAIEMLQEAKRKDEDAEYLQSTGNSKLKYQKELNQIIGRITKRQKQKCHNRLAEDAQRRRITQLKSEQQEQQRQLQYIKENQFRARQSAHRKSQLRMAEAPRKIKKAKKNQVQGVNKDWQQNLGEFEDLNNNLLQQQMEYEQQMQYEQYLQQREQEQNARDQQQIINIQSQSNAKFSSAERSESSNYGDIAEDNFALISVQKPGAISSPNFLLRNRNPYAEGVNSNEDSYREGNFSDQEEQGVQDVSDLNEFNDDEKHTHSNNLQNINEVSKDSITDEYYNE